MRYEFGSGSRHRASLEGASPEDLEAATESYAMVEMGSEVAWLCEILFAEEESPEVRRQLMSPNWSRNVSHGPQSWGKVVARSILSGDVTDVLISPLGLSGLLRLPEPARALVLFAHGSGSGRLSPRNNHVAEALRPAGLATLLFDLLTENESADRANVFDIELLAGRLEMATTWVREQDALKYLPMGYFGASTGAAAALVAAAHQPERVGAIVSRGGRPDMAGPVLKNVQAPTLLIVGGNDAAVLELNREALAQLRCEKALQIVPGATHLFEEPGTLDQVIELARTWFVDHLIGRP